MDIMNHMPIEKPPVGYVWVQEPGRPRGLWSLAVNTLDPSWSLANQRSVDRTFKNNSYRTDAQLGIG